MSCHDSCCGTHSHQGKGNCGCHSGHCHCCGGSSCGCHSQSCGSHQHSHGDCCDKAHKLLEVADMAWMEVLKEKIKEHIKANDHKIDEIARIVAEANHSRWQQKIAQKQCCNCYEEQLKGLFGQCSVHGHQQPNGNQQSSNSKR